MATKAWKDVHPVTRKLIICGVVVETALKAVALVDLAKRPAKDVHGKKWQWATAISLVNAFGAVPLSYFACHGKLTCPLCKGGDCRCGCCPGKDGCGKH